MKHLSFLFIACILNFSAFSQEYLDLFKKVEGFYNNNQYDSALYYTQKTVEVCKAENSNTLEKCGKPMYFLAVLYMEKDRNEEALVIYKDAYIHLQKALGELHPDLSFYSYNLASLYKKLNITDKAIHYYRKNLEILSHNEGRISEKYLKYLNEFARYHEQLQLYEDASLYYSQALDLTGKIAGKDHQKYGLALHSLAYNTSAAGKKKEAISLYQEAIEHAEKYLEPQHADLGIRLNDLALCHASLKNYDQALPLYQKALSILETSLGREHSYYGECKANLATLYDDLKRYKDAINTYNEVLINFKSNYGKEHFKYLDNLTKLAISCYYNGQFYETIEKIEQVINNVNEDSGSDHDLSTRAWLVLAFAYEKTDQHAKALPVWQLVSEKIEKEYGTSHKYYWTYASYLAKSYQKLKEYDAAIHLFQNALAFTAEHQADDLPLYRERLLNLAGVYLDLNKRDKAIPLVKRVLELTPDDHKNYVFYLNFYSGLLEKEGLFDEAIAGYQKGLKLLEQNNNDSEEYKNIINKLVFLLTPLKRYEEAIPLFHQLLKFAEDQYGKNHPEYASSLYFLGSAYFLNDQFEVGMPYFKEALSIIESEGSVDKEEWLSIAIRLADTYFEMDQYEEALQLYQRSLKLASENKSEFFKEYEEITGKLAAFHKDRGDYLLALPFYREYLAIARNKPKKDIQEITIRLNSLANIFVNLKDYYQGAIYLEQAVEHAGAAFGKDHEYYIDLKETLHSVEENLKAYKDNFPGYLETVRVVRDSIQNNYTLYRQQLDLLTADYIEQEYFDQILQVYEWEKEFVINTYGKEHKLYGYLADKTASIYQGLGKYEVAIPHYKETIANAEKNYGKNSSVYYIQLSHLADCIRSTENYEDAEGIYKKALNSAEATVGTAHPDYSVLLDKLALLYEHTHRYDEAIILYEQALQISKNHYSEDQQTYELRLLNLATCFSAADKYEDALHIYKKLLQQIETSSGKQHLNYTYLLDQIGQLHLRLGQYEEAGNFFKQAINGATDEQYLSFINNFFELAEKCMSSGNNELAQHAIIWTEDHIINRLGKENFTYFNVLQKAGILFEETQQYNKAINYYQQCLDLKDKIKIPEKTYFNLLERLARCYNNLHLYEDALPIYRILYDSTETDDLQYLNRLQNLCLAYSYVGKFSEINTLIHTYEKTIKAASEDPVYDARIYILGGLYVLMGEYDKAIEYIEKSLDLYNEDYDSIYASINYGNRLLTLSKAYQLLNNYQKAYFVNKQALKYAIHSDQFSKVKPLRNLGELYSILGREEEALSHYIQAIEEAEVVYGKQHLILADLKQELANLYVKEADIKNFSKANELYYEAINIIENNLGTEDVRYIEGKTNIVTFLNNTAYINEELNYNRPTENSEATHLRIELEKLQDPYKNYTEAISIIENLLTLLPKINAPEFRKTQVKQSLLKQKGMSLMRLNQYESAIDAFEKSGDDSGIATCLTFLKRYDEAEKYLLEDNEKYIRSANSVFRFSNENEKGQFIADFQAEFDYYQSVNYLNNNKSAALAQMSFNNLLLLKNLLLNSSVDLRQSIKNSNDKETKQLYSRWLSLKKKLAREYSKPFHSRTLNTELLENEANNLESELVQREFKFEQPLNLNNWNNIRQQLNPGEVAIEFSAFNYFPYRQLSDSTLYVAYIITSQSHHPEIIYLFEENQLDALLKTNTPSGLYASRGTGITTQPSKVQNVKLYDLILKPILPYLEGVKKIYYAPVNKLHQVSFAALTSPEEGMFGEKYQLIRMNSTAGLLKKNDPLPAPALLVGGVNYDYKNTTSDNSRTDSLTFNPLNPAQLDRGERGSNAMWRYLPGTADEVNLLQKLYHDNNLKAIPISNENATEDYFKSLDGESPKVIHIATHGFFFQDPKKKNVNPNGSSLYSLATNPLLRSGVLLAGANMSWTSTETSRGEDGILTAYEISQMDLSNTDLVVLSACETGLGDIEASEGVYGLQRAFKMAGVNHLVMSLWKVPDKETTEFMEIFYSNWLSGENINKAFSDTQIQMSQKYDDPVKWAGFILVE